MTSQKQIEANKQNALKSTGAKTEEGKTIVSQNALKHGILSSEAIIKTDEIQESEEEMNQIVEKLVKDLQPVGMMEEILIDRIATAYWRLRRAVRAEKGAIRRQTDDIWFKEMVKRIGEADSFEEMPVAINYRTQRMQNSVSATRAKDRLEDFKKSVEANGYLHEEELKSYIALMNLFPNKHEVGLIYYFNETAQGKVENEEKEKGTKALLYVLEKDIKGTEVSIPVAEELEQKEMSAKALINNIPNQETSERISRYETALENQLYKALNELIKLQTIRKGGKVISIKNAEIEGLEP